MLSKNFVVPNVPLQEADSWPVRLDLVQLLEHSLLSVPELKHAFEKFSLGAFLDGVMIMNPDATNTSGWRGIIAHNFFDYLEANVSLPSSRPRCQLLGLIMSVRKNLNFIAIIPPSTCNMLCIASTVTPVQRNSTS